MRRRPLLIRLVALVSALWCIGLLVFVTKLPSPGATPNADPAEAIVVLTGGAARISAGFSLLDGGAPAMLITGVHPDTSLQDLVRIAGVAEPECCVELDYSASNTLGNVRSAVQWATANNHNRLRLVTSWYHIPRSLTLFEQAMPGVTVTPHPVVAAAFAAEPWWQTGTGWRLVIVEYTKLLWDWTAQEPTG